MDKINRINNINNIENIKAEFLQKQRVKINNFLEHQFAELLYKHALIEKAWILSTGIDKMKYEKNSTAQFQKLNDAQIKNVGNAFSNDRFSYIFYRAFNGEKMTFLEYSIRQMLSSNDFIDILNQITGLGLTKLTTMFLSKYKSGNFLSPHSDKGNGRLAFVINLSKFWKPQYGGVLHFMNEDRTEILESFVPSFNTFVIFHVPEEKGIPHFVGHVAPNVKHSRYSITGWFD